MLLSFDAQDDLCIVCQRIVPGDNNCWHNNTHFHIGTLGELIRKLNCPFCRLILASIRFPISSSGPALARKVVVQQWNVSYGQDQKHTRNKNRSVDTECIECEPYLEVILDRSLPRDVIQVGTIFLSDAMGHVNGRAVSPNIDYDLIKSWMGYCETLHLDCSDLNLLPPRSHNIRLVDVYENRIVLLSQTARYVALSYVWGPNTTGTLTKATLSQYSVTSGLRKAVLPQTILDCIRLVQSIGQRYLWIDSLCILQDDDGDKLKHLPAMDTIYHHAHLVIVAATGNGAHAGLHGTRDASRHWQQQRQIIRGTLFITGYPPLRYMLNQSTWNSRGWTFQEAMLARRILFFTELQIYWSCRCGSWREDMEKQIVGFHGVSSMSNSFWVDYGRTQCRMADYCRDVGEFTKRQASDTRDAVWAFIGILRLHKTRFAKGFIWGLPIEKLDAALLWDGCSGDHQRQGGHTVALNNVTESLNYPSWSWFSRDTPVEFHDWCGDNIISQVTWHEPLLVNDSSSSRKRISNPAKLGDESKREIPTTFYSAGDVMSYGLLQLTAETIELTVVQQDTIQQGSDYSEGEDEDDTNSTDSRGTTQDMSQNQRASVVADVYTSSNVHIGMLEVVRDFFKGEPEKLGAFVLLSANVEKKYDGRCTKIVGGCDLGDIVHAPGCEHIESYNIMLVEGMIMWFTDSHFVSSRGNCGNLLNCKDQSA